VNNKNWTPQLWGVMTAKILFQILLCRTCPFNKFFAEKTRTETEQRQNWITQAERNFKDDKQHNRNWSNRIEIDAVPISVMLIYEPCRTWERPSWTHFFRWEVRNLIEVHLTYSTEKCRISSRHQAYLWEMTTNLVATSWREYSQRTSLDTM